MRAWIRLPSPAMGVALIALVVALSGTTYAAVRIGTKQIKNNAITSAKIRNGQVRNVDLARNSVVTAKIVASAVTGLQIRDASVGNADLGNDAVTGAKMRGGAVGNSDLANDAVSRPRRSAPAPSATRELATDAVTSAKIKDGSIGTDDYGDASIVASKIKDGEVVKGNGRMLSTALTLPDGAGPTTLLSVPGLGALRASCANGVTTTQWQNTSSGSVTVVNQSCCTRRARRRRRQRRERRERRRRRHGRPAHQPGVGGQESVMWQASDDSSGGDRVSTLWVTAGASGTSCRITAQGIATATP